MQRSWSSSLLLNIYQVLGKRQRNQVHRFYGRTNATSQQMVYFKSDRGQITNKKEKKNLYETLETISCYDCQLTADKGMLGCIPCHLSFFVTRSTEHEFMTTKQR